MANDRVNAMVNVMVNHRTHNDGMFITDLAFEGVSLQDATYSAV